jgi:hypothetical protein
VAFIVKAALHIGFGKYVNNWSFNPICFSLWLPDPEAALLGSNGIDWMTDSTALQRGRQPSELLHAAGTSEPMDRQRPLRTHGRAKT